MWRHFGRFPYRHGDALPFGFSFNSWFGLSGYGTSVIANFHYPLKVAGPNACGNCEGIGMLMRLRGGLPGGQVLEEVVCVLCHGTGSHQVWLQREWQRFAQYDHEQRNLARRSRFNGIRLLKLIASIAIGGALSVYSVLFDGPPADLPGALLSLLIGIPSIALAAYIALTLILIFAGFDFNGRGQDPVQPTRPPRDSLPYNSSNDPRRRY